MGKDAVGFRGRSAAFLTSPVPFEVTGGPVGQKGSMEWAQGDEAGSVVPTKHSKMSFYAGVGVEPFARSIWECKNSAK